MRVCLDTNAYSDWARGISWAELVSSADLIFIPSIVLGELREGFLGGTQIYQNEAVLSEVLSSPFVQVIDVDESVGALYAEMKIYLKTLGRPIPVNDVWIAASCVEKGATLLTRDRHFEMLPQVRVQWPEA